MSIPLVGKHPTIDCHRFVVVFPTTARVLFCTGGALWKRSHGRPELCSTASRHSVASRASPSPRSAAGQSMMESSSRDCVMARALRRRLWSGSASFSPPMARARQLHPRNCSPCFALRAHRHQPTRSMGRHREISGFLTIGRNTCSSVLTLVMREMHRAIVGSPLRLP